MARVAPDRDVNLGRIAVRQVFRDQGDDPHPKRVAMVQRGQDDFAGQGAKMADQPVTAARDQAKDRLRNWAKTPIRPSGSRSSRATSPMASPDRATCTVSPSTGALCRRGSLLSVIRGFRAGVRGFGKACGPWCRRRKAILGCKGPGRRNPPKPPRSIGGERTSSAASGVSPRIEIAGWGLQSGGVLPRFRSRPFAFVLEVRAARLGCFSKGEYR